MGDSPGLNSPGFTAEGSPTGREREDADSCTPQIVGARALSFQGIDVDFPGASHEKKRPAQLVHDASKHLQAHAQL